MKWKKSSLVTNFEFFRDSDNKYKQITIMVSTDDAGESVGTREVFLHRHIRHPAFSINRIAQILMYLTCRRQSPFVASVLHIVFTPIISYEYITIALTNDCVIFFFASDKFCVVLRC